MLIDSAFIWAATVTQEDIHHRAVFVAEFGGSVLGDEYDVRCAIYKTSDIFRYEHLR
jgi:hypothetical protein